MFKRLLCILLACALAVQPVYADNAKRGKRQKTKEEVAIEKAENWMADWVYKHCPTGTTLYVIR